MDELLTKTVKEISSRSPISSSVASHFTSFFQNHKGNISGLKIAASVKDPNGNWYETSMRIFKNGSIHIKNT